MSTPKNSTKPKNSDTEIVHRDSVGSILTVGSIVVTASGSITGFQFGEIDGFSPKMVRVKVFKKPSARRVDQKAEQKFHFYPSALLQLSDEQAFLWKLSTNIPGKF